MGNGQGGGVVVWAGVRMTGVVGNRVKMVERIGKEWGMSWRGIVSRIYCH